MGAMDKNSAVAGEVESFMHGLIRRNPGMPEFHQAVREVVESLMPFILEHQKYRDAQVLERMTEPDRVVIFRVAWEDDEGNVRVNRAWRVQFNSAIGPYKGGLRFHKTVTLSVLKFLAFEQTFKNSLTRPADEAAVRADRTSTPRASPTARSCGFARR